MTKKIIQVYLPFLIIFIGFISVYSYLNWYFILRPVSDQISKDWSNYWIPFALPIVPVFLIFHFIVKPEPPKWVSLTWLYFVASVCISPTAILAQYYLESATGKLTELETIDQIVQLPKTKYYTIKNYQIDQKRFESNSTCKAVKAGWDFQIFIVCPVLKNPSDTATAPIAWLTKRYYKNISRLNSNDAHLKKEAQFLIDCYADFKQTNLNKFCFLTRTPNDLFAAEYTAVVKKSSLYDPKSPNILLDPANASFGEKSLGTLYWLILSAVISNLAFLLLLYIANKDFSKHKHILKKRKVSIK